MAVKKDDPRELARKLGRNILEKRLALGLTREELAERLEIIPQSVYKMEVGERFLSAEMMIKVCEALEIKYHQLFDFDAPNPANNSNPTINKLVKLLQRVSESEIEFVYNFAVKLFRNFRFK